MKAHAAEKSDRAEIERLVRLSRQKDREIERLREELAFYADDRNYRMNGPLDPNSSWFSGATRAKDALK